MNERKRERTACFFAERIEACQTQARLLRADGREDEAVFAKVQANVYDIFKTVFTTAINTSGQEDEKAVQFFLARLRQIPQNWYTALSSAEQHGEHEKAHIERIKLDTVEAIKAEYERIWEETT